MKSPLTRLELGEALFQAIRADLISRGFALWQPRFDPDYPVSLRTIFNIRKGIFDIETINKLPNIKVEEFFTFEKEITSTDILETP